MSKNRPTVAELTEDLNVITRGGIQVDRRRTKENMCTQFGDYREWIREYCVNAYDAKAWRCVVSGKEEADKITIVVEDDGHGMDRAGIIDFMTVFRSVKQDNSRKTVGRHGVGKLSVAAIPGQCGFSMTTSTGKECWYMEAGCLLDDDPITLKQVEPVPQQGTHIEITFKKKVPLHQEMKKLSGILLKYLRYLPFDIIIDVPDGDGRDALERPVRIRGSWTAQTEKLSRIYNFDLDGKKYEVVMGLGTNRHEIYQNRVFITCRYNLLFHDLKDRLEVPHLTIRVDSPDFELPFGRHCLRDEEVLHSLAVHLRENILPQYVGELLRIYEEDLLGEFGVSSIEIEELACTLIAYDHSPTRAWCRLPVFATRNQMRLSLAELQQIVDKTAVLYLEDEDVTGVDYTVFDAPVLDWEQPKGALEILEKIFNREIINLAMEDVVLEAPAGSAPRLGSREKRFQQFLGFHPEVLDECQKKKDREDSGGVDFVPSIEEINRNMGVCEESLSAREDLAKLQWRVNYLIECDGRSVCRNRRLLFKNDTVVLNLNYPEVQKMLELSETAPALAGHWALAMCLTEDNRILPHLTPEAREDLILMDAMAKCGNTEMPRESIEPEDNENKNRAWREFRRNIEDNGFAVE